VIYYDVENVSTLLIQNKYNNMKKISPAAKKLFFAFFIFAFFYSHSVSAQEGKNLYDQIKNLTLTGKADVSQLVLKRDRAVMTFNGTFYFTSPAEGRVTGAVFVGQGTFRSEVPSGDFEKENVKRLLKADVIESDFKTAVLRFSDDTFDIIGKNKTAAAADPKAQKLASEIDARILEETGANLTARLAASIINKETPGFFFANFDEGNRGRFSFLLDYQNRIPTSYFDINAGEKGLIFAYESSSKNNEIWTAFYGLDDYRNNYVSYSDVNDVIDITHYKMDLDLREPKRQLGLKTTISLTALKPNVRMIPFTIGESLGESENQRLKKQMRLRTARLGSESLQFIQEDWEGGFTVILPNPAQAGQKLDLELELEGDFIQQPPITGETHYPRSNTSWYPHHGYLDRATYEMSFSHSKKLKVATVGTRQSEKEDGDQTTTVYKMNLPVSFVTFALAPFKRYNEQIKWDNGDPPTQLEYNSLTTVAIKEDFIMAELNNSVRYFHALFGKYPYEGYGAAYHPFGFGQGFPSMLVIPGTDRANKYTYAFIAHETAHQWWGNIVAWRSYRDQWLSEGFAEYSGILYTSLRKDYKASVNMVDEMRNSLKEPPRTQLGYGKGRLNEVGPLILGHRLDTSKTYGAYSTLVYNKGALVLRMLHFLFTDPNTGNGDAFFAMMKDFVEKYRNNVASTDDFRIVANRHFANSPIARKYGVKDLNWFFRQWVYETGLPSYTLEYTLQDQPDGSTVVNGSVIQENVPENWAMVLPIYFGFGENKLITTAVLANGPKMPFSLKLPQRPKKVELDPQKWILSEKTTTK
jgi:Peptidase family M1 domain